MSDKQKSIAALSLLVETCKEALSSIAAADGIVPNDLSDLQDSEFAVIRKDFISLLAFLYSAATKTAISLKPSSPTFSASLTPIKDLTTNVSHLSSNVRLVRKVHGAAILKEVQEAAQSVITPIQSFATLLLTDIESSKTDGEQYLAKVGEIHHAIEQVRGTDGLSSNNAAAVRKVWSANQMSLDDALRELQEMAEDEGDGGDDFDDGWDELGIESSPKLTGAELERLKKLEAIIKLCSLLHKTITKKVFSPAVQALSIQEINPIVDDLALVSATLPAAIDDLIATVYSPQDPAHMNEQVQHTEGVISKIQSHLDALFALEPVGSLMKEPVNPGKKGSSEIRKWFETCFGQIKKSTSEMSASLQDVQ